MGSALSEGPAIQTIITGDLTVHGDFLGGTLASEYFDITIHGNIEVGIAANAAPELNFQNGFIGGFRARTDYNTAIDGAVIVNLAQATFGDQGYGGGTFTGGGIVERNRGYGYSQGSVTVRDGIHVNLTDCNFTNTGNAARTHVLGIRTTGGVSSIQNGVNAVLENVGFLGIQELNPEYAAENPDLPVLRDKLVGGAVDEDNSGKADIHGVVSVTVRNSSLKLFYGGGYSTYNYSDGERLPVDVNRRGGTETEFYKVITVRHGDDTFEAVNLQIDGSSFLAVSGGGRNIEVIGDVTLHFNNTTGSGKATGEIIYGSGIGIWHKGNVELTVTGGYEITDRLVGGGGGAAEIMKPRLDEYGYQMYDENGEPIFDSTGIWDALLDGNVRIDLSGGSSFNTVYGGSDCRGIDESAPEIIPARIAPRSAHQPDQTLSTYGRPTEITGTIQVSLDSVTVNTYVGAGLGTVGRSATDQTVVTTQFGRNTVVRDFIGGSLFTDYMQGDPVIHGDIRGRRRPGRRRDHHLRQLFCRQQSLSGRRNSAQRT